MRAYRTHLDDLRDRARPLLTGVTPMSLQDGFLAQQVSETCWALDELTLPLLNHLELFAAAPECGPEVRARWAELSADYHALAAGWKNVVAAIDAVLPGDMLPQ